jgi:hypothetical protein
MGENITHTADKAHDAHDHLAPDHGQGDAHDVVDKATDAALMPPSPPGMR